MRVKLFGEALIPNSINYRFINFFNIIAVKIKNVLQSEVTSIGCHGIAVLISKQINGI